jgi:cytochrome c-type biogenesis protein CcmF
MDVGDTVNAGGYTFLFKGVTRAVGPNYEAARAELEVSRNGTVINKMYPEKRSYTASGSVMTETAIRQRLVSRSLHLSW